ncbi:MAG: FkbM family methyltransferase [Betaproteobacteria bacterium]|nr:FkbM family methyltransferase [Betaproteobacteria bacterium]
MSDNTPPPPLGAAEKSGGKRKGWLSRKKQAMEKVDALRSAKEMADVFFGTNSEISKRIGSELRFRRLKAILGGEIVKFLRIHEHERLDQLELFTLITGIDLAKEIESTDEALIIGGIKLPRPLNEADRFLFEGELADIVLPSYLKRKSGNFDPVIAENSRAIHESLASFFEGPYEDGNVCFKEGDIVFDCGANMGLFSAVASRYGCKVFAFEPIPDTIDNYLSKTASMNGNICVCNFAVWDKEETLDFSMMLDNIGASRCDSALEEKQLSKSRKQFTVPAITLDAFVEQNGIGRVDFIKADIEGAERNMLCGATRILKEFAPKLSICTYHLPDDPEVLREIILVANPKYQIVEKFKKMYAYVP